MAVEHYLAESEKHPIWVAAGVFGVGLVALYALGYIGGGSSSSASTTSAASSSSGANLASAYYAAEAAQTQAGDALIANQQTNTAQTAQALALDNANVAINSSYANNATTQTKYNDAATIATTASNNQASVTNTASNNRASIANTASSNQAAIAESNNQTALGQTRSQNQMATSIITAALPAELANGAAYSAANGGTINPNTTLSNMFWGLTDQPNANPTSSQSTFGAATSGAFG